LLKKNRIYKSIILPVVLYRSETWSLALREEHKLRMFENRVLRRIFGLKRDEVTGEWRKTHNEELHDLYSSPSIIIIMKSRKMKWMGHVTRMGEKRNVYTLLVGNPEGKRPLRRPRLRGWIIYIKINFFRDVGVMWTGMVWLRIEQVESSCEFGIEPSDFVKCWETIECPNNWGRLELCSAP
jgi:hypothetical protein